jgi:hypothetical protein
MLASNRSDAGPAYKVTRNSDYSVPIQGDDRHIDAVLLEIRNDLIGNIAHPDKVHSHPPIICIRSPQTVRTRACAENRPAGAAGPYRRRAGAIRLRASATPFPVADS